MQLRDLFAEGISAEAVGYSCVRAWLSDKPAVYRPLSREASGADDVRLDQTRLAICHKRVYILVTKGACNAWIRS